jgi:RNA polymerase sigma-70 factor (ECF subfamily)
MADGVLDPKAFGALAASLRPRLHRYCARMVGSAFDGEDVVQETLAKAAEALAAAGPIERPESWLFRIAHNTALDALRRRKRQEAARAAIDMSEMADETAEADARVAAAASLSAFMSLSAAQRSCVVLMDVLGYSLAETVAILGVSLASVKAALHRGRARLRALTAAPESAGRVLTDAERDRVRAYADHFNARDFDALRNLLAEDVRLDLVNRRRLAGRTDVAVYFTHYEQNAEWRVAPGRAEGRPALLFSDPRDSTGAIRHVVLVEWKDGRIANIRDFHFAPYVMEGLSLGAL